VLFELARARRPLITAGTAARPTEKRSKQKLTRSKDGPNGTWDHQAGAQYHVRALR